MQSHFGVEVRKEGGASVITVKGELDLASTPALEEELDRVARTSPSVLIVDLRELDFMDSTGLSVLVRAHQRAQDDGQRFAVINGAHQVRRLLKLTGVADRLTVVESPDELLEP
jgi:anti-sigma B factor antagonist